jgi:hypothetical protein
MLLPFGFPVVPLKIDDVNRVVKRRVVVWFPVYDNQWSPMSINSSHISIPLQVVLLKEITDFNNNLQQSKVGSLLF